MGNIIISYIQLSKIEEKKKQIDEIEYYLLKNLYNLKTENNIIFIRLKIYECI